MTAPISLTPSINRLQETCFDTVRVPVDRFHARPILVFETQKDIYFLLSRVPNISARTCILTSGTLINDMSGSIYPSASCNVTQTALLQSSPQRPSAMVSITSCRKGRSSHTFIRQTQLHRLANHPSTSAYTSDHKRQESSEERGSQVSTHALQNPNWRNRSSDEYDSIISQRVDDTAKLPTAGSKMSDRDALDVYLDSAGEFGKIQNKSLFNISRSDLESGPLSSYGNANVGRRWASDCANGEFDVIKQVQVFGEPAIQLFEISASRITSKVSTGCTFTRLIHGSETESSRDRQRSLSTRRTDQTTEESQDGQLMAALSATNTTPPKVRGLLSAVPDEMQHYKQSSPSRELEISKSVPNSGTRDPSVPELAALATNGSLPSAVQQVGRARQPDFRQKDDAFAKMLQKLHARRVLEKGQSEQLAENRHQSAKVHTGTTEFQQAGTEHRKPTHGSGRRVNTASDSGVSYWNQNRTSHESECPDGSQYGRYNTLNPKAREFCSLGQIQAQLSDDTRQQFSSSDTSSGKNGSKYCSPILDTTKLAHQPWVGNLPPLVPVDPTAALPHFITVDSGARPPDPGSMPACALGLVPVTSKLLAGLQQLPCLDTYGLKNSLSSILPQTGGQIFSQGKDVGSNLGLISDLRPLPLILPGSRNGNVGPVQPNKASARPHPVPKPKRPDPADQQAYEQWVEFRKANEPGYAIACKLRQQRRAQRSYPQKQKQGQK